MDNSSLNSIVSSQSSAMATTAMLGASKDSLSSTGVSSSTKIAGGNTAGLPPEVKQMMMKSIAENIIHFMQGDQDRVNEAIRKARDDAEEASR